MRMKCLRDAYVNVEARREVLVAKKGYTYSLYPHADHWVFLNLQNQWHAINPLTPWFQNHFHLIC